MSRPVHSLFASIVLLVCLAVPATAAPLVLFDESHAQPFRINQDGPLDLSALAELYRNNGYDVQSHTGALTGQALAATDLLVLSGPFAPLSDAELQVVLEYLARGGGLAVMLHVAPPMRQLLHRLEVDYTNGTLRETNGVIAGNPQDFRVAVLADHPVTADLRGFSLYGAWALRGTAPDVRIIAETSQRGWVDLDRNNQLTPGDAVQPFGVMVAGALEGGRFVVIGDDALFQNRFLDEDNRQLALALARWLTSR